jgi:hypothetical protein
VTTYVASVSWMLIGNALLQFHLCLCVTSDCLVPMDAYMRDVLLQLHECYSCGSGSKLLAVFLLYYLSILTQYV